MNERKLVKKMRNGNAEAYRYLFLEYYEWLCNYIFKMCNNRHLAEDIVQDTFVNLWEKRAKLYISGSVKNYLFKCCYHQFLQQLRVQKIDFDALDKVKWEVISDTAFEREKVDVKIENLNVVISKLPPRCKEVFVQNKIEQKKYKEIALDLGISVKTVENQMSKALHFIREHATIVLLWMSSFFG
ncbi:RNA polymerase sigma-70 factor [Zobellia sp. OII3]|uniref:RNA polymerase sigma factor n=1 Tax=Zobellia sp. OII3 TaxID=2034520 RepID=UPI000B52B000|nr:RNA polymerase sigma-70 factor [Zobellia sp. OII3]OWW27319.1 RNA polymerase sigma-70 factor [Zobellia sp. OII3]